MKVDFDGLKMSIRVNAKHENSSYNDNATMCFLDMIAQMACAAACYAEDMNDGPRADQYNGIAKSIADTLIKCGFYDN